MKENKISMKILFEKLTCGPWRQSHAGRNYRKSLSKVRAVFKRRFDCNELRLIGSTVSPANKTVGCVDLFQIGRGRKIFDCYSKFFFTFSLSICLFVVSCTPQSNVPMQFFSFRLVYLPFQYYVISNGQLPFNWTRPSVYRCMQRNICATQTNVGLLHQAIQTQAIIISYGHKQFNLHNISTESTKRLYNALKTHLSKWHVWRRSFSLSISLH